MPTQVTLVTFTQHNFACVNSITSLDDSMRVTSRSCLMMASAVQVVQVT